MRAVANGSIAVAIVAAFCVAGVALAAALQPADIAGRWTSDVNWSARGARLAFDISPCRGGWCGVEVKDDLSCGGIVLRLGQGKRNEDDKETIEFEGRIELASGTQPYVIRAHLHRGERGLRVSMFGNTGDEFELFRRNYPFRHLMVRSGDAVCRPDAKVS